MSRIRMAECIPQNMSSHGKKQTTSTLHPHPHPRQTDYWQKPGLLFETECRFPNSLDSLFPKEMRNKYLKGTSFMFLVQSFHCAVSVFSQLGFPWNSCTNGPRNSWNRRPGLGRNWNHFHSYFPSCPDSLHHRLCLCPSPEEKWLSYSEHLQDRQIDILPL